MVQGLVSLNHNGYVFQRWHGTLLFYAIILFSLMVNTYLARLLPKIEAFGIGPSCVWLLLRINTTGLPGTPQVGQRCFCTLHEFRWLE